MTGNHMRRELAASFPGRRMQQKKGHNSDLTLSSVKGRKPLRQCGDRGHSALDDVKHPDPRGEGAHQFLVGM